MPVGDDVRAGVPSTAITDQNINQVETCILIDRCVTVRETANELSLSVGSVETVIHERLKFSRRGLVSPFLADCSAY